MPDANLGRLTIAELSEGYRAGELTPVEVVTASIERLERLNPRLNAYITIMAEAAIASAREAEAELRSGRDRGPLHGVPISLKDIIATAGVRTTAGSRILADNMPVADATVTSRLRAAGAVLIAKTNLSEFAYSPTNVPSAFGPAHNPWNLERVTGGSSGGSGAGVSAGGEYGTLGSDTGGSIRIPASYCGIVGLKQTFGLVSRTGVVPLSWTLDTVGPLTRTVRDNALLLQAIAGFDATDPGSVAWPSPPFPFAPSDATAEGMRVGVPREYFWERLEPTVLAAVRAAIDTLEQLGATIVEVSLPHAAEAPTANAIIIRSEGYSYHEKWLRTRPDDYTPTIRRRLELGAATLAVDYLRAQRFREVFRHESRAVFSQVDVLVTPTMPCVAPPIDDPDREHVRFTSVFNMLGVPAISLPCGFSPDGLPIGLQIVGRPFEEGNVYRLAHAYEQATDWHTRRPPVATITVP